MESELVGVAGLAGLMILLMMRLPIGIALIGVSFAGIWYLMGLRSAWGILAVVPHTFVAQWTMSSVPMFLLMGFIAYHGGLTKGLFDAAKVWLNRVPGSLAIASIFGSTGFAAVSGSSVACAAAMGRIAVPEMLGRNYSPSLATGAVAAGGTLGALIPPSVLLIIYGAFSETPISKLFVGGLVIGFISATGYMIMIMVRVMLNPALAPRGHVGTEGSSWDHLRETWPVLALFGVVMGGLTVGFFTATEAGAVGAFAAVVIGRIKGSLSWDALWQSIVETLSTTAGLFLIAIGASLLSRFMALSGSDAFLGSMILSIGDNPFVIIAVIAVVYLILGMFLDPLGAMLMTLPVFLPVLSDAQVSTLWFGIFLAKLLEVGMLTPPIGLNVFVIKSVVGDRVALHTIFKGVGWFIAVDLAICVLIVIFPEIVTYFPNMGG